MLSPVRIFRGVSSFPAAAVARAAIASATKTTADQFQDAGDNLGGQHLIIPRARSPSQTNHSEEGMVWFETLVELKFINSIFSSLSSC